jgi:hypothetical protein
MIRAKICTARNGARITSVKSKKLAEIMTWITSHDRGLPAGEVPKCRRRPKKPSKGILKI